MLVAMPVEVFVVPLVVRLLKVVVAEPPILWVVPSKVTAPELWVKVPELAQLPTILKAALLEAVNAALALIVNTPSKSIIVLLVAADTGALLTPSPIVKLLLTLRVPVPRSIRVEPRLTL